MTVRATALLGTLTFLLGCDAAGPRQTLVVDLLGSFDDTEVRVEVDRELVFEGAATTGAILATAGAFPVDVAAGEHVVFAVVEGRASARLRVHTDTTAAVGVQYNPEADRVTLRASPYVFPHR